MTFPWTEHLDSTVHALVMVEQDNPNRQGFIKAEKLAAVHRIIGKVDPIRVDDRRQS